MIVKLVVGTNPTKCKQNLFVFQVNRYLRLLIGILPVILNGTIIVVFRLLLSNSSKWHENSSKILQIVKLFISKRRYFTLRSSSFPNASDLEKIKTPQCRCTSCLQMFVMVLLQKLQDVESSAKLLDEYEDKLSRAEMAIEERETQIKNLKQQVNKKSNHFHNLTLEQEKSRKYTKTYSLLLTRTMQHVDAAIFFINTRDGRNSLRNERQKSQISRSISRNF